MQLLNIVKNGGTGCSQVHKQAREFEDFEGAYELVNNRRSLIHKFISKRISARYLLSAYELMNNFALKKEKIIFLLINGIKSHLVSALRLNLSSSR
jgi:hypothetical protein